MDRYLNHPSVDHQQSHAKPLHLLTEGPEQSSAVALRQAVFPHHHLQLQHQQ